jgi:hypothetical protein
MSVFDCTVFRKKKRERWRENKTATHLAGLCGGLDDAERIVPDRTGCGGR